MRQCVAYGRKVYDLRDELAKLTDDRTDPAIDTYVIASSVFFCGLLRIRSFKALEPKLGESTFVNLVGHPIDGSKRAKLGSADTLGRVMRVMGLDGLRSLAAHIVNKVGRRARRILLDPHAT